MLNEKQMEVLRQLSFQLEREKINWLCIGGLAAIAWGAKRPLADIDIQVSRDDIEKVSLLFQQNVATPLRHYVTNNWDIRQMIIRINDVGVDICQAEEFYIINQGEKYLLPNYIGEHSARKIRRLTIPVLPKSELIKYKEFISRPVDYEDLKFL